MMTAATQTDRAIVAITYATDYSAETVEAAIERQLTLLNADKLISRGDSVLIKPNFIAPSPPEQLAQTHPEVVLAVARALKDMGAKPFVGDSPAWSTVDKCVSTLGLTEPLKKLGVPFKQLSKRKYMTIAGKHIGISTDALEADRIVNLPKLKSHQQMTATIAVKNMFGCVAGKQKAMLHFSKGNSHQDFALMLIEVIQLLKPTLNIIDGIIAMQGQGPIHGSPRPIGAIIGSIDPIACETICAEIINLKPEDLPIVRAAREMNFGCSDRENITIIGDDYRQLICREFVHANPIPLKFTLPRICKSITKQLWLLLAGGKKNETNSNTK